MFDHYKNFCGNVVRKFFFAYLHIYKTCVKYDVIPTSIYIFFTGRQIVSFLSITFTWKKVHFQGPLKGHCHEIFALFFGQKLYLGSI